MADGESEQVEILRPIWNEMKGLNSRVDQTNTRLDAVRTDLGSRIEAVRTDLGTRIDQTNARLDASRSETIARMTESEVRVAPAMTQLAGDVQQLTTVIRDWREEHRADRAALAGRITRVEDHVGIGKH